MGRAEVVRERVGQCARVLGAVRVCESDLDTGCAGELESIDGAELCVCWRGVRGQCGVFGAEFVSIHLLEIGVGDGALMTGQVSCTVGFGCQNLKDTACCRGGAACGPGDRD